jgi:mono/diheme cytochrome c family protein
LKRPALLLFVLLVILFCLAGVAATLVLHDGLSARATPTKLEAFLARHARQLATPANARSAVNPLQPTEENLRDARMHFADHCAICHGNDGSGQTMLGGGMYPKPPDLRLPETQSLSDGELFWIIEHGVRFTGMPAFGGHGGHEHGHGDADDSWKLVLFIRHIPQLAPQERMEMEQNNPKGPEERKEEQEEDDFLNQAAPPASKKP